MARREQRFMLWVVLMLLASFAFSTDAMAQANLHDPSGSFTGLLDLVKNSAAQWDGKLRGYAQTLFWLLASIQFVWTFMPLVFRQADFGEIVGELIRFILVIGFFYALLLFSAEWADKVVDSFRTAGATAAGLGDTQIRPGDIFGTAIELANTIGDVETWNPLTATMVALAGLLVDEYAKRFLPEDTARFAYLLSRLKKSMTGLLCYLRDEQNQSQFRPVACELKIGSGADAVPGQLYHLSDGRTVQLIGTVDRADEWVEEDGTRWVRVVDYKTGTKKLDLKEVYCGLDCQMLLYLFSLTRDPSGRFTGAEPAGVLYLLADPAPETTTREKAARSVEYQLDGLVRDEQKIFDAMDADETGRYLPFGYRNGAPSPYQKDKRADIAKLNRIRLHLDDLVTRMGEQLYGGQIAAEPLVVSTNRSPCAWCDYDFICCHETGIGERGLEAPAKPFEPEAAEDEEEPT